MTKSVSRSGLLPRVAGAALQPCAVLQVASCSVLTTRSVDMGVQCVTVSVLHPTPSLLAVVAASRAKGEGFAVATVATVPGALAAAELMA